MTVVETDHGPLIIGREGLKRNLNESIVYTDNPRNIGKLAYDDRRGYHVRGTINGECRKIIRDRDDIKLPVSDGRGGTVFRKYQVELYKDSSLVPDCDCG